MQSNRLACLPDPVAASAVYLNGRFAVQALTGVQRFATEITNALAAEPGWAVLDATLLVPRTAMPVALAGLRTQVVGSRQGHGWEQLDLPRKARGGLLLNLGNTGPIRQRRQLVVIHDAGVFSTPESYSLPFRNWYRLLHRMLARRAKIVTVSEFARTNLAARLHLDPARIGVVPEGAEHILRAEPDPSVLATNGLAAGRYALVVGSLAPHKNLAALSETATRLAERGVKLAITGALNAKVFAAGGSLLPQHAVFLGRVDDAQLRALYAAAACFVFPSYYEGFGLPAVEAMACGCPVTAARAGSLPEVCGPAAVYFDPRNPADIAEIVCRLVDTPPLAAELRRQGRLQVRQFTWTAAAQSLLGIVQTLRT